MILMISCAQVCHHNHSHPRSSHLCVYCLYYLCCPCIYHLLNFSEMVFCHLYRSTRRHDFPLKNPPNKNKCCLYDSNNTATKPSHNSFPKKKRWHDTFTPPYILPQLIKLYKKSLTTGQYAFLFTKPYLIVPSIIFISKVIDQFSI